MSTAVLRFLESQGYFDKAAAGDHRACGLFARLAAYEMNPSGDPNSWGCLRKTGGGANVEGYSEDAIVFGNDPTNLRNVVDLIIGAGVHGARLVGSLDNFVNRRPSDVWEKPVPLTAEQMDYLKPGSGHVEPGNPPVPVPVPVPPAVTCQFQPFNLEGLVTTIERLQDDILAARDELLMTRQDVVQTRLLLADLIARMEQGFVIDANIKYLGAVRGTVRLPKGE